MSKLVCTSFLDILHLVATNHVLPNTVFALCVDANQCMRDVFEPFRWLTPLPVQIGLCLLTHIEFTRQFIEEAAFPFLCCNTLKISECRISEFADFTQVRVKHLNMTSTRRIRDISKTVQTVYAADSNLRFLHPDVRVANISGCHIDFSVPSASQLVRFECSDPSKRVMSLVQRNAATLEYLALPETNFGLDPTCIFPQLLEYDCRSSAEVDVAAPLLECINVHGTQGMVNLSQYPNLHSACIGYADLLDGIPATLKRLFVSDISQIDQEVDDGDLHSYFESLFDEFKNFDHLQVFTVEVDDDRCFMNLDPSNNNYEKFHSMHDFRQVILQMIEDFPEDEDE